MGNPLSPTVRLALTRAAQVIIGIVVAVGFCANALWAYIKLTFDPPVDVRDGKAKIERGDYDAGVRLLAKYLGNRCGCGAYGWRDAMRDITAIGEPAIDPLFGFIVEEPGWAKSCIEAAVALGPGSAERARPLLSHEHWDVRITAARILGHAGDESDFPLLLDLFENDGDKFGRVRLAAGEALIDLGDPRGLPPLRKLLASEDIKELRLAAWAMGRFAPDDAVEVLLSLLDHPDEGLRRHVTECLGEAYSGGCEGALVALAVLLHDEDEHCRIKAVDAVGRGNSPEAAALLFDTCVSDGYEPYVGVRAVGALREIRSEFSFPLLVELAKRSAAGDGKHLVRALYGIRECPDKDKALQALIDLRPHLVGTGKEDLNERHISRLKGEPIKWPRGHWRRVFVRKLRYRLCKAGIVTVLAAPWAWLLWMGVRGMRAEIRSRRALASAGRR